MSRPALLDSTEYPDPGKENAKRLSDAATAKLPKSRPAAKRQLNFPTWAAKSQRPDPWARIQRQLAVLDQMAETLIELRKEIARLTPAKEVRR